MSTLHTQHARCKEWYKKNCIFYISGIIILSAAYLGLQNAKGFVHPMQVSYNTKAMSTPVAALYLHYRPGYILVTLFDISAARS